MLHGLLVEALQLYALAVPAADIILCGFEIMADNRLERPAQFPPRGAGAILFSSLVHQGWQFPAFVLTDSDERYLFDLEV